MERRVVCVCVWGGGRGGGGVKAISSWEWIVEHSLTSQRKQRFLAIIRKAKLDG